MKELSFNEAAENNTFINRVFLKLTGIIRGAKYIYYSAVYHIVVPIFKIKMQRKKYAEVWKFLLKWSEKTIESFEVDIVVINEQKVDLDKQYIVTGNHRSWLDHIIWYSLSNKPVHFLGKSGFFDIPLFGYSMKVLEYIKVNSQKLGRKEMESIFVYTKRKESIGIFVEGTRGTGNKLLPFKPGAFSIAAKTGVNLLPIFIFGSEERLSKNRGIFNSSPGTVVVKIEEPWVFTRENIKEKRKKFESWYIKEYQKSFEKYSQIVK